MKRLFRSILSFPQQHNGFLTIVGVIIAIVSLISIFFAFNQVTAEKERLTGDIRYRSSLLADSLKESVEPNFINKSDTYLQSVVERFADKQRIAGLAIVDNTGKVIAISSSLPKTLLESQPIVSDTMDSDSESGDFLSVADQNMYLFATPLRNDKSVVGALVIVQNASYIDSRLFDIWMNTFLRLLLQSLFITVVVLIALRLIIYKPIQSLVTSVQDVRLNRGLYKAGRLPTHPLFKPLMQEVSSMQQSLIKARLAASEEARLSLEKIDSPWTEERLKEFTKDMLKHRTVIAVSNLEPYIHTRTGKEISYHVPASGLITAIEPVMEATGGIWVAQGSGSADRLVVDKNDSLKVPLDEPKYTLKRIWLTEEEIKGYSLGFSDQAMYPLCHMTHTRPIFREEDWEAYKQVNAKFSRTILTEIKDLSRPIILIQDFQFTLVSRAIKEKRPDATIGIFWHIPWVSAEAFSICPWRKEIVDGMLGADLIGFHTQQYCNNFIDTVGHELEALIDYEQQTITRHGHTSFIKPFPISIAFANGEEKPALPPRETPEAQALLKSLGVQTKYIGIGADRLDHIKGVMERLTGLEIFFTTHPEFREQVTFIQISSPSETTTKQYVTFAADVEKEVERINDRFKTKHWKPILYLPKHHTRKELTTFYRLADFCLITSLHDGMNLVAKEFVASRSDERGVLILSQFAGAAREMKDAIIINPYNGKQTAQAIHTALTMGKTEQTKRMQKLRTVVKNYNIYRWSAEFLKTLVSLE
jgi:trehalose 6-phosphate synthase